MREMFDAIAPRYDLVNRVMTFRLDVRWRRRTVEALALPAGQPRARPGQRHRRPVRRPRRRRAAARSRSTCQPRDAARRSQRRAACPGRHPAPAGARRHRRRRHVRLRPAQPRRPAGVLRRARPRRAPRRAHRPARRRRAPQPARALRPRHLLRQGRASRSAGCCPTRRRTATCRAASPTCRRPTRWSCSCVAPGSPTRPHRVFTRRHHPAAHRHRGAPPDRPDAGRHSARRRRHRAPSTSTTSPAATASCSSATASGSPGAASPPGSRSTTCRRCSARSTTSTRPARRRSLRRRPGRPRLGAVRPGRRRRGGRPGGRRRQGRRRPSLGHQHRRRRRGTGAAVGAAEPTADAYTIEPVTPVEQYLDAVAAARDAVRAGRHRQGGDRPRDRAWSPDRPIDRHGVLHRLKASFGSSYRFAIDGFVGASPELLVERRRARPCASHPLAGTAPRTGDPDADAEIAAELVASTKNQVEHRVVIDMVHDTLLPWCSYLDWEPEPSIVTVANVQHLGTRIEGRLSSPPPNVLELVRALSPDARASAATRGAEALALIAEVEGVDRGRYGGAVGWVDAAGNGTWAVAIRCAELVRRPHRRPPARRRRHRRRQRPAGRAGRDPGQVPGDAVGARPAVTSAVERRATAAFDGGVHGDVRRPDRWRRASRDGSAARRRGRPARPAVVTVAASRPWAAARATRSVPCGVPNSCSKRAGARSVACGRNEKMPPPSLSTTTIRRSTPRRRRRGERAGVVDEGDVAEQHDRRSRRRQGDAERRRHHAVDAVGAAVGVGPGGGAAEPLEVAHRHRRGDHELGIGGQHRGDRAGDRRLGERRLLRRAPARCADSAGGAGLDPVAQPRRRRRRAPRLRSAARRGDGRRRCGRGRSRRVRRPARRARRWRRSTGRAPSTPAAVRRGRRRPGDARRRRRRGAAARRTPRRRRRSIDSPTSGRRAPATRIAAASSATASAVDAAAPAGDDHAAPAQQRRRTGVVGGLGRRGAASTVGAPSAAAGGQRPDRADAAARGTAG